jgi:hypothetical protein
MCVCACLGSLAVFPCGPLGARLLIWSRDLHTFAGQSGWVGPVPRREANPQQPDIECQNDASPKTIVGEMTCLFEER